MTTRSLGGELRARPMAIANISDNGRVYFATDITSMKVDEVGQTPQVNVSFQSRSKFLSLSGVASVIHDSAIISDMWQATWNIWFPDGKDDPRLCLLQVDATRGEYWDMSGLKSIAYLWEAGVALLTGDTPSQVGDHGKVLWDSPAP